MDRALRLMTYNVHGCVGTDGRLSPERVAEVIAAHGADVVALQECDVGRARSGKTHQPETIARDLEMDFYFSPAWRFEDGHYGNAILSRFPLRLVREGALPSPAGFRGEQRGALWAEVELADTTLQVVTTHLGLGWRERRMQGDALASDEWLAHPSFAGPRVLCGDFNSLRLSRVCRRLGGALCYAGSWLGRRTFPSAFPLMRLDHVFVGPELRVGAFEAPSTELTRAASDHLPLVLTLHRARSSGRSDEPS